MKIKKRKVAPPPRRDALTTDSLVCKILMRTPLNLDAGGGGAAHGGETGGETWRKNEEGEGSCGGRLKRRLLWKNVEEERGREVMEDEKEGCYGKIWKKNEEDGKLWKPRE